MPNAEPTRVDHFLAGLLVLSILALVVLLAVLLVIVAWRWALG